MTADTRTTAQKLRDMQRHAEIQGKVICDKDDRIKRLTAQLNDERAARMDAEIRLEALRQRVAAAIAPYAALRT